MCVQTDALFSKDFTMSVEYSTFFQELKYSLEHDLFQESCPLTETDKKCITNILVNHSPLILRLFELQTDFVHFHQVVILILVNKVADEILAILPLLPSSIQVLSIIKFFCFASVVSFTEWLAMDELEMVKLNLEQCFRLLDKQIPPVVIPQRSWRDSWYAFKKGWRNTF